MTARFIVADVMDGLASLETGSVDLVVTSPPFLALRSYLPADHELKGKEIGSESTPAEFIDTMLKVTAELRRVLAPHGSICVELGDTYAGSGGDYAANGWREGQPPAAGSEKYARSVGAQGYKRGVRNLDDWTPPGGAGWPLSKSRTLIPSLFEIALAYGINPLTGQPSPAGQWRIRNVVTWARPNPPVGALGDKWRPATSDLIIACTSGKRYWDDLATRKPSQGQPDVASNGPKAEERERLGIDGTGRYAARIDSNGAGAPLLDYWVIPLLEDDEAKPYGPANKPTTHARTAKGVDSVPRSGKSADRGGNWASLPELHETQGAPLLDYWVILPGGYTGAHYAVFPEELVIPCVQAMCPQRVCVTCGQPSRRVVDGQRFSRFDGRPLDPGELRSHSGDNGGTSTAVGERHPSTNYTDLGWTDCGHDTWRPGLVLDPFAGSGTTLAVATGHGHDAVGIDLDSRNADLARDRVGPFLFEMV